MFTRTWFRDTAERALATFAEAAIGVYILVEHVDLFNVDLAEGALTAGVIAGLAVVKGALAGKIGQRGASLDPELKATLVATPEGV